MSEAEKIASYQFLQNLQSMIEALRLMGASGAMHISLTAQDGWRLTSMIETYVEGLTTVEIATIEGDTAWVQVFGCRIEWPKDISA